MFVLSFTIVVASSVMAGISLWQCVEYYEWPLAFTTVFWVFLALREITGEDWA